MVTQDPHLKEVFPEPPLIAYKHPPNLKSKLIRAKVPKANLRPRRVINGTKPCNKPCDACPFVETTRTVKSSATNMIVDINAPISCDTTWLIYVVNCQKILRILVCFRWPKKKCEVPGFYPLESLVLWPRVSGKKKFLKSEL